MTTSVHTRLSPVGTSRSFHLVVASVSIFTVPIPIPSSVCPSPSVTVCLFDNSLRLTNCSRSLHKWLVAPESTIHFQLDTVEKV